MLKAGVLNGLSVGFRCGSADAITKVAPFLANFGTVLVPCSLRMSDPLGSMLRCSNGLPTFGIHNTRPGLTGPTDTAAMRTRPTIPQPGGGRP
jgi:hypothetical protein